ncbi:hypothetical protein CR513_34108, partial [Mucuna pruriens]
MMFSQNQIIMNHPISLHHLANTSTKKPSYHKKSRYENGRILPLLEPTIKLMISNLDYKTHYLVVNLLNIKVKKDLLFKMS